MNDPNPHPARATGAAALHPVGRRRRGARQHVPLAGCGDGMPDVAVRPWTEPGDPADLRRWMLAHALLAPNPHNRQPWLADLRRDGEITLVCDGERLLPETDPFGRQIVIGCGAFIELR